MVDSSTTTRGRKPKSKKPKAGFPLFKHARGYWAKKVLGDTKYFGRIADDPEGQAALDKWLAGKDAWLNGREPRDDTGKLTVEDLCDHFLNAKRPFVTSGDITQRTYDELFATCKRLTNAFGLSRIVDDLLPADFDKLRADTAKKWGPVRLGNEIQRVRSVFKWGFESGKIERPVRFGPLFTKPKRKVIRKLRASKGPKMIEAADLRKFIDAAGIPLKAMILLALNGGLGNSDVGHLPLRAIDIKRGWIVYPRPKTGIERRFPLWPQTIKALKAALAKRPEPKDDAAKESAFVTKYGGCWAKDVADSPVTKEFRKLLDDAELHRPGIGFYSLRHIFATIGGESRDQVATSYIMGHADDSMAATYRERISDERLQAVTDYVRKWLFPKTRNPK